MDIATQTYPLEKPTLHTALPIRS
uniref:Uncharacterized protein n=1 Tax=Arundo donax TaxID=35708 RepID=A0A0A9HG66_ARUDO